MPQRPHRASRSRARRWLRLGFAAVLTVALVSISSAAPAATVPLSTTARTTTEQLISSLQDKTSAADPRYTSKNVWVDGSPNCLRCTLGPSVLAAAHGRGLPPGNGYVWLATTTLTVAIRDHQRSDGAFVPPGSGENNPAVQTAMVANEIGSAYLILGDRLTASQRASWASSMTKAADWLIRNGDPLYCSNGNINLSMAISMDLAARITGLARFQSAARSSLAYAIAPPQSKCPGLGLKYTKNPTRVDGSDGAAYFAEKGSGKPGYDPSYTLLQVNLAATWFMVTRSPDAKRLTNLIYNQLAPRIRTSDWTIDVGGGTRLTTAGVRYAFNSAAISVLALKGGRSDLIPKVRPQVLAVLADYPKAVLKVSPYVSYNLGVELAPIYLATTTTSGW